MSRPKADTLYHVLKYRAETQPNDPAYVYLINGEEESHPLTYKELQEASKQLAGRLQALNMHGERALLIFESDYNYIISFFACIYAGVISVPLHPPGKNKSMSRISAIAMTAEQSSYFRHARSLMSSNTSRRMTKCSGLSSGY